LSIKLIGKIVDFYMDNILRLYFI